MKSKFYGVTEGCVMKLYQAFTDKDDMMNFMCEFNTVSTNCETYMQEFNESMEGEESEYERVKILRIFIAKCLVMKSLFFRKNYEVIRELVSSLDCTELGEREASGLEDLYS